MQLQLFTSEDLLYNADQLLDLATASLRYKKNFDSLLLFYDHIKSIHTKDTIRSTAKSLGVSVRSQMGKCLIAQAIAQEEYEILIETSTALEGTSTHPAIEPESCMASMTATIEKQAALIESKDNEINKLQTTIEQLRLTSGKQLSRRILSKHFLIMGQPLTLHELKTNWRSLRYQLSPHVTDLAPKVAEQRSQFINKLYEKLSANWNTVYNPELPMSDDQWQRSEALDVDPNDYWANYHKLPNYVPDY